MLAPIRILSLEAGGERISAALFESGCCVAEIFEAARQRQTERLAPMVKELLETVAWSAASLNVISAGRGPGSFTGLRSSLALGAGLSFGTRAKLVGINTLEAWAQASGMTQVAVALDGRRGQVYFGRFDKQNGDWKPLEVPALMDVDEAWSRVGTFALSSDLDGALVPKNLRQVPSPQGAALAVAVGQLTQQQAQAWEPLYLRRPEAEILWEKLHPKAK